VHQVIHCPLEHTDIETKWLTLIGGIRLTAYNSETIPCLEYIEMSAGYLEVWEPVKFYVVDVPEPAVVGLPTSEQLNLVTINVDSLGSQAAQKGACPIKIKDVNDLVIERWCNFVYRCTTQVQHPHKRQDEKRVRKDDRVKRHTQTEGAQELIF